ncbi:MAG: tRNA (guanosine(37)-N1)-methyltransferase TrmD [Alphaproteobacteria bacterium]|jgi:tRNA (guanine37-N1)-methyltransferase|nr:tRNA (guanosine(37)-N1)-methyltransferase TrmD [Alphaproteobacteria bacterium]MDP6517127.1 tRNA (guanosine(37)-N1)-methyltransferase TrmD [Alphaproteobacteria bacterium]
MTRISPWTATVLTLFPDMFPGPLDDSLAGAARKAGLWVLETVDIRDFAGDKHRSVDEAPFGGGAGMVMRPDVLAAAIDSVIPVTAGEQSGLAKICLTPRGHPLTQRRVRRLAAAERVVVICGRFEGIDQRAIESRGLCEISIGDFVLSGGELAAMALIDACVRLLPGVVGNQTGLDEESFEEDLLEYPHFTRPREWEGRVVPEVLLSGNHERIRTWRRAAAEQATRDRRPDLWDRFSAARPRPAQPPSPRRGRDSRIK